MSLNDRIHMRTRARWPVQFDIEGVDRDPKIRQQKLNELNPPVLVEGEDGTFHQEQNAMKVSNINQPGRFDFNNPPKKKYVHEEFPRLVYNGAGSKRVNDEDELAAAVEAGYTLTREVRSGNSNQPRQAVAKPATVPEPDEEVSEYFGEGEIAEAAATGAEPTAAEAAAAPAPKKKAARAKKTKPAPKAKK